MFTHILAADENNLWDLQRRKPKDSPATVRLWGSYLDGQPIQGQSGVTDTSQFEISHMYLDRPILWWIGTCFLKAPECVLNHCRTGLRKCTSNAWSCQMPS